MMHTAVRMYDTTPVRQTARLNIDKEESFGHLIVTALAWRAAGAWAR
jgi:hypothetical protein